MTAPARIRTDQIEDVAKQGKLTDPAIYEESKNLGNLEKSRCKKEKKAKGKDVKWTSEH
jgi:hypothetical protein